MESSKEVSLAPRWLSSSSQFRILSSSHLVAPSLTPASASGDGCAELAASSWWEAKSLQHRLLEILLGQDKHHFCSHSIGWNHQVTWPRLTAKEAGRGSEAECPQEGIGSMTTSQSLPQGQGRNIGRGRHFHRADHSVGKIDSTYRSNSALVRFR